MNTLGVIQARMGSSRFPGKMMKTIGRHVILEWVLRRCKKAELVDHWVLATSSNPENDPLEKIAEANGIECFRGSEDNVLSRFIQLSQKHNPENIVRVCADNPFIDPGEIDRLILFFRKKSPDYAFNHIPKLGNNYIDGLGAEIFTSSLLKVLSKKAVLPKHIEHATSYIWDHSDEFSIETFPAPEKFAYPEIRFDVDEKADLEYLNSLLYEKNIVPEECKVDFIVERIFAKP